MDMDGQLRRHYSDAFDVDLLDTAGKEDHRTEGPEFVCDLFFAWSSVKVGAFGPTSFGSASAAP